MEETHSANLTSTDHDIYYLNENGNNTLMVVKGSDPGSNNGTRLYCMNLDTSVDRSDFTFDIMDFDAINVRNKMFTVFGTGDSSSSEVQFTLNYCIF